MRMNGAVAANDRLGPVAALPHSLRETLANEPARTAAAMVVARACPMADATG